MRNLFSVKLFCYISSNLSKLATQVTSILISIGLCGALFAAPPDSIGKPEWTVPTKMSTDDGYADLQ